MSSQRAHKYDKARRRLAAITFLSNISLDGSLRGTELCHIANRESKNAMAQCLSKDIDDNSTKPILKDGTRNRNVLQPASPERRLRAESESAESEIVTSITPSQDLARERCLSGSFRDRHLAPRGKRTNNIAATGVNEDKSSPDGFHFGWFRSSDSCIPEKYAVTKSGNVMRPCKGVAFRDDRLAFAVTNGIPCVVYSTVPAAKAFRNPRDHPKIAGRRRNASGSRPPSSVADVGMEPFDVLSSERGEECGQDISYSKLLVPSQVITREQYKILYEGDYGDKMALSMMKHPHVIARCFSYESQSHSSPQAPPSDEDKKTVCYDEGPFYVHYCPNVLDDPELIVGKNRTMVTFTSYMTSIIENVRPQDLKKELNDKFREKFPHIKLTLSKMRSIKREMRKIAKHDNGEIDLLSVAQAYVYFEKLILANLINKENRKLCAGACLLLSAKLNDVKGEQLKDLIERIESTFRLHKKDLMRFEFAVLVALEFGLHVPPYEVFPHYQRLLHES